MVLLYHEYYKHELASSKTLLERTSAEAGTLIINHLSFRTMYDPTKCMCKICILYVVIRQDNFFKYLSIMLISTELLELIDTKCSCRTTYIYTNQICHGEFIRKIE